MDRRITFAITVIVLVLLYTAGLVLLVDVATAKADPEEVLSDEQSLVCFGEPEGELIVPTHEVTVVVVSVHWQDSPIMLQVLFDDPLLVGYSECEVQEEQNLALCDLYVVRPTHVYGDQFMDTLGHELLHGLFGTFHD